MKFLLLSAVIFCSFSSFAKMGYVNMMAALENTKEGKRVRSRLEKITQKAKKDFQAQERKIQKEEEALKKEAPLLSEQSRAEKIQKLQQKIMAFQRRAKEKDLELQKLQNKLMSPVLSKAKKIIGEIAQKEGFSSVQNMSNDILWVSSSLNLTQRVTKIYNKRHK